MPKAYADSYLAKLSADKRATLETVRKAIRAAAPDAEEGMSYGLPAFIQGKAIAGYGASANHCSYFPMSGGIVESMRADLEGYETSKGAIRFPVGKPLPAPLIRKLVRARLAEIAADTESKRSGTRTTPAKKGVTKKGAGQTDPAVIAYLRDLDHPLKKDISSTRKTLLGVDPGISEGIKWKVPSFRTAKEYFATFNVRAKDSVQLIFHLGAKTRPDVKTPKIPDPKGLVEWLAKDRCMVTLGAGRDLAANRAAFEVIVRAWIKHV